MRYLPLLLANLGRKKVRTVLTCACFAVALFLYGVLATVRNAFAAGVDVAGADPAANWSLSNLASLLRLNLFTYRDLKEWLAHPLETPPLLPPPEQLGLDLPALGQLPA